MDGSGGIGYTPGGTDWRGQEKAMGGDQCAGLTGRRRRQCRQGNRKGGGLNTNKHQGGGGGGGGRGGGGSAQASTLDTAGSRKSQGGAATSQLPTAGGQYTPGASKTTPVSPSALGQQVSAGKVTAPAGSFAAGLGEATGLPMASNDPQALINSYMSNQYGLPFNSTSAQLADRYLNPADKVEAILGYIPGNDIDMVNFGASLIGGAGMGTQLDPARMVSTIMNVIQNASGSGGEFGGTSGAGSVLNAADPQKGLQAMLGMLSGALVGTMPDQALANFLTNLESYAQQFISGKGGFMNQTLGDFAKNEGAGTGWFGTLLSRLGPSLGL